MPIAEPPTAPGPLLSDSPRATKVGIPSDSTPVAELRNIRKTYYKPDGSIMVEALKGVDLIIPRGEYVAIMGASGSGKSTLMNILGCLDRPTDGQYLLDNRDIKAMSDEELSLYRGKKIGFIFQAFNLSPQQTVLDNVETPLFYQGIAKPERTARASRVLDLVGLGDRLDHRPRELSGGQQQRVAIARALVGDPVVLMADEPTGNLDSSTGQHILALFESLNRDGMTIIMVTHDESIAQRCRRVVRLKDGVVFSDIVRPDFAHAPTPSQIEPKH
jgi:putative ABC transport system ATP-binding protein